MESREINSNSAVVVAVAMIEAIEVIAVVAVGSLKRSDTECCE